MLADEIVSQTSHLKRSRGGSWLQAYSSSQKTEQLDSPRGRGLKFCPSARRRSSPPSGRPAHSPPEQGFCP